MSAPTRGSETKSWNLYLALAILLLAAALRFYHLGDKGLWGDESAQAKWSLLSIERLWTRFRDPPDFPLHFFLVHFSEQIGLGEFWARLPSALLSELLVAVTFVTARRMLGELVGFVAMFLVAISPQQIWYAQEARMYAGLSLYATLSLYFFLRLLSKSDWRSIVGLTIANGLSAYNHLFGILPIAIEGTAVLVLGGYELWQRLVAGKRDESEKAVLPDWLEGFAISLGLTLVLTLPLVSGTVGYVLNPVSSGGIEATFQTSPFVLTSDFAVRLFSDFGLAPDAGWRAAWSFGLALLGTFFLFQKSRRMTLIPILWLAFPVALLQATHPLHTVANRYLLFMQPVYLILIAAGIVLLVKYVLRAIPSQRWRRAVLAAVAIMFLLFIGIPPLQSLYARAKLNDWKTLAKFVQANAQPGDILTGEKGFWAVRALGNYLPNLNAYSSPPGTIEELQESLALGRRIWYVSFGGFLNPQEEAWVQEHLVAVPPGTWQRSDLVYQQTDEFQFTQSEELVTLYRHDGELPTAIVYQAEMGDRSDTRAYLPLTSGETLEAKLYLPGGNPRVFELVYSDKQDAKFQMLLDGKELGAPVSANAASGLRTMKWEVASTEPEVIFVQARNLADSPLLVRSIRLLNK